MQEKETAANPVDEKPLQFAPASEEDVRKGFAQVEQQVGALVKTFRHNSAVVQQGFYANDIWFTTLKNALLDIASTQSQLCDHLEILPSFKRDEVKDGLDLKAYWEEANKDVRRQVEEASKKEAAENSEPLVPLAEDEEVVEFGGDYGSEQDKKSS